MDRHVRAALTFGCVLAIANLATVSARAEFPPEGAISDPSNPSIASGDYPDPAHNGVMHHYIFYFDCGKRDWIGVSVAGVNRSQTAPPQAVGKGKEFPSGPPPGSKVATTNANRATSAGGGQAFSLRHGVWFDAKTGKPVTSPRLCPDSATLNREPGPIPARREQAEPAQPTSRISPKPDLLPPPPQYLPDPASRPHS